MPEDKARGSDRAGRRSKRMLSPSQKYEVWLQLVRQELTMAEAAAQWQVDRSTIMRIRTVAKEGALFLVPPDDVDDPVLPLRGVADRLGMDEPSGSSTASASSPDDSFATS